MRECGPGRPRWRWPAIGAGAALALVHAACASAQNSPCTLDGRVERPAYAMVGSAQDSATMRDLARTLDRGLVRIPGDLGQPLRHRIVVEVYPDQACYDRAVADPEDRGTPAVSGDWKIQMVSPRAQIRVQGIPYAARLEFVDHELAHLVLNEMNSSLPMWLVEGVPTFEGSAPVYREVCRRHLGRDIPVPSLQRLMADYGSLTGADVLAFTLVEHVVDRYGQERLNRLIRAPGSLEAILGVSLAELDRGWQEHIRRTYRAGAQNGARS